MRVLHLFSNAKWTGPAEPALNLCLALRTRGVEADFACAPDAGSGVNKIVETARDRGLEPFLSLHLSKHRHPVKNWRDRRALAAHLARHPYDLIHCHLDNDHRLAVAVAGKARLPLLRSSYAGDGLPQTPRHARLLSRTDWIIEPSQAALEKDAAHFRFDRSRMTVLPGAVDGDRFDPRRETPDGRRWLNLPRNAFAVGIVARMQTHRHYEELFVAFRRLVDTIPEAQLIVVGRGTKQEQVGFAPVRDLGLEDHVHFTGFIDGENYVGMLRAFDVGIFLTPGSDGTCRAAREIMAMGKPMVVADRGMLAEIVGDGKEGFVVAPGADPLFEALSRLHRDRALRRRLGAAALDRARREYSLDVQAARLERIYQEVIGSGAVA